MSVNMLNISDNTRERFNIFIEELLLWNQKFNLVSRRNNYDDLMQMVLDCAGLHPHLRDSDTVIDLGSGAGFPGVILAIMGCDALHLVERSVKKCQFLQHIVAKMGLNVTIHACDLRDLQISCRKNITVVAKAVSSCEGLADICYELMRKKESRMLLLKGARLDEEIAAMRQKWSFKLKRFENQYRTGSVIAEIKDLLKLRK